jgi:hypothetical protein
MARRIPFGVISFTAAAIGVLAFVLDAFIGGAEALGHTNGSGHGGNDPTSSAGYVAYVCSGIFVIAIASWFVQRQSRRATS